MCLDIDLFESKNKGFCIKERKSADFSEKPRKQRKFKPKLPENTRICLKSSDLA